MRYACIAVVVYVVAWLSRGTRAARPEAEVAFVTMRRQISLQACITIPTRGATTALATLCALLVAEPVLALALICSVVAALTLGPLAPTMRRRFRSPHMRRDQYFRCVFSF